MSEMEARVARAIHAVIYPNEPQGDVWGGMATVEGLNSLAAARAAIEVMREPTLSQCQKAALVVFHDGPKLWRDGKYVEMAERMWPAMIDAALAETP